MLNTRLRESVQSKEKLHGPNFHAKADDGEWNLKEKRVAFPVHQHSLIWKGIGQSGLGEVMEGTETSTGWEGLLRAAL